MARGARRGIDGAKRVGSILHVDHLVLLLLVVVVVVVAGEATAALTGAGHVSEEVRLVHGPKLWG